MEQRLQTPVRIAVIGCGAAFENLYARPLRRLEMKGWGTVAALVDPGKDRQRLAMDRFTSAVAGASIEEVWSRSAASLAILASPPPLHLEHAAAVLERGGHVFCEKPLADSVSAGRRMNELAAERGRILAVGQTRRFYPALAEIRKWLEQGRLGRVHSYRYSEGGEYAWPVTSAAPFHRETSGGGVLLDKGAHVMDLLAWLFGRADVISHHDDAGRAGVEGLCSTQLDHAGIEGRVTLSWSHDLMDGFLIRGEAGDLWMMCESIHHLFHRPRGGTWVPVKTSTDFATSVNGPGRGRPRTYYDCFDFQLVQVLRALIHGEDVPADGRDGLAALEVIAAAYGMARPLSQPWLDDEEQRRGETIHWSQAVW